MQLRTRRALDSLESSPPLELNVSQCSFAPKWPIMVLELN